MNKRLREVPNSIEELSDKRDWMNQIPEQIRNYRVRIGDVKPAVSDLLKYMKGKVLSAMKIVFLSKTG